GYQLVGDFGSAHFRLQVVGCHFRRVHQYALLTGIELLPATAEKEGDMGVFFGFGNAQLGFAEAGDILAKGVDQGFRRVGAMGVTALGEVGGILGGHDKIRQLWPHFAFKTAEIVVHKGLGDFAGAVGAEVHKDYAVAVADNARGFALVGNQCGFDKFVILAPIIG